MKPPPDVPLDEAVRRRHRRRERARREGERSLAQNLALAGVLGWIIVAPALLGALAGRWLDRRFATGVLFTGALLVVGLAAGCALGWREVRRT